MDFTLFFTEYLYDMYEAGIICKEQLIELYLELCSRGENSDSHPTFNNIQQKLLLSNVSHDSGLDDLIINIDQSILPQENTTDGEITMLPTPENSIATPIPSTSKSTNQTYIQNPVTSTQPQNFAVLPGSSTPQTSTTNATRYSYTSLQTGRGLKHLTLIGESEKSFKRFGVTGRAIAFKFKEPISDNPLEFIKDGLNKLLNVGTRDVDDEDYVGLVISSSESPDRPIAISFRKKSQVNVDVIMKVVTTVHQSNASFLSTGTLLLNIHAVKLPMGYGRNRKDLSRLEYHEFIVNKRSILPVINYDNNCLAYAVILAIALKTNSSEFKLLKKSVDILKQRALALCQACNINLRGGASYEHLQIFQNYLNQYTIVVYNDRRGASTYFEGPRSSERIVINLFFNDSHYDIITSLTGFFGCSYFCEMCKVGYKDNKIRHTDCPYKCNRCHQSPRCSYDNDLILCNNCNRDFRGGDCFNNHKISLCHQLKKCLICLENVWLTDKKKHQCGHRYCRTCNEVLSVNHLCFMQPDILTEKKKEDRKRFLFIFYDIEAMQETKIASGKGYLHEANLLVSQQVCVKCINNNDITVPCENCGIRQYVFKNNPVNEFLNYISRVHSLGTFKITAIAHNMKGYDGCFILKEILSDVKRWNPEIIRSGVKIISISCGKNLRFIDSLNYMPLPLSKLPGTFKFEGVKGYFPYLFNTSENQNYNDEIPPVEFYVPQSMKTSDRKKFLFWYKEQVANNTKFNMAEEIVKYCVADVDILRNACIIFRDCFLSSNNVDPFLESTTIASACNLVFRRNFLLRNTIGIAPKGGYRLAHNQSRIALKWLFWLEHSLNINICHAGNGREIKLKEGILVDGYDEASNSVYQFHGCFYHGCEECYPNQVESVDDEDDTPYAKYELMFMRRERTAATDKRIIDAGYNLVVKWECDFAAEMKTNRELMNFISNNPDLFSKIPLNPRDSFFGGRTNAVRIHHKVAEDEKICYLDVCSLYPFVNKYGKYPIGHPQITVGVNECGKIDLGTVEGIIKCTVLPPHDLYHPVLPYRCDGKLTFPLCRTCVESKYQDDCRHLDEERKFTGTFVADELRKAIETKYIILAVHEVWEYEIEKYNSESKTGGLFTGYVNNFLQQKVENSGWPTRCKTDDEKQDYVNSYLDREGVKLDVDKITHNAGLRYNSKLMLNSFWGKFGQRENMMQSSIISEPRHFFKLLCDPSVVVHDIVIFGDNVLLATWDRICEDVTPIRTVSVAVAAYTTACARLELYKYLEMLDTRVLYFDTDSVIFTQKPGDWMPTIGDFLGQLTDEVQEYGSESFITEFVSGGPKNYAFNVYAPNRKCDCNEDCTQDCNNQMCTGECRINLSCNNSCKNITVCKVKGITLNYKNSKIVNFESMRNMVLNPLAEMTLSVFNDRKIVRTPQYDLVSVPQSKMYRTNYTKRRRVQDSYDTLPYGYTCLNMSFKENKTKL